MDTDDDDDMRNLRYRVPVLMRRILERKRYGPNMPGADPARQLAGLIEQVAGETSHQDSEAIAEGVKDGRAGGTSAEVVGRMLARGMVHRGQRALRCRCFVLCLLCSGIGGSPFPWGGPSVFAARATGATRRRPTPSPWGGNAPDVVVRTGRPSPAYQIPGRWVCVSRRFVPLEEWEEREAIREGG